MEPENVQERRRLPRCGACKLPADLLAEVHRERLAWGATFEQLAEKLRSSGHATSTSALCRHFRTHVSDLPPGDVEESAGDLNDITTPFDGLLDGKIREQDVTEAVVHVLVQRMQRLEKEQQAVRDQSRAERLWTRSLKTMAMLERALKRLEETRKPERDVKKLVAEAFERASLAIMDIYKAGMQEQIGTLKQGVYDFLDHRVRPEEFLRQIKRWEDEWPRTMTTRLGETLILSFRAAGAQA